ncbi:MAG: hypothetical protein ACWGNV_02910 [Bacteroidales bacterium]
MIDSIRFIWQLLVLASILLLGGLLLFHAFSIPMSPGNYLITVTSATLITLISFLLMSNGIRKNGQGGMVLLMAGLGVKFLLYLMFLLVFWLVVKNLSKPFVLTFFALYLTFTFFLAIHLFKLLKNK